MNESEFLCALAVLFFDWIDLPAVLSRSNRSPPKFLILLFILLRKSHYIPYIGCLGIRTAAFKL
jgi:hypothetical protein